MRIVPYQPQYRDEFIRLNTEWLTRYYWVEDFDQDAMDRIDELIANGAMVYFALENDEVLATCMTMPLEEEPGIWEMCKLAARNQYTGTGAGNAVFQACMNYAIMHGARRLVLISCTGLKPAIHLYRKNGFREVPYRKDYWKSEKADIEMEKIIMKQYIVDAFTDQLFHGNQAAICILEEWLPEELMMSITRENNFSETAFAVPEGDKYHLRWFTPGGEIDLCGHATLACAYVLFTKYLPDKDSITFSTLSGDLIVRKSQELMEMEFPAYHLKQIPVTPEMEDALGARPKEAYLGRDLLCVFDSEETVRNLHPDQQKLLNLEGLGLQATAPGKEFTCVSRSFFPKLNVAEDPVCGSGHCHIIPYWSKKLNTQELTAYQASPRGGILCCHMDGDRVFLAGKAVLFSESVLNL